MSGLRLEKRFKRLYNLSDSRVPGESMGAEFRLGQWLVEPSLNTVSRNGSSIHLEPKVMEVLVCLARRPGEAVPKDQLLQTVWPETFVTDDVLIRSISELRRVFEDDARDPQIIQTIPKRGYRLVANVDANTSPATSVTRDSIAVLPFINMSADAENEYFADGITEEIINALAQIKELHVVARSSAFSFKGKHVDPRTVGEQLNVRTVLEGSVRKAGSRLRITAQLVSAADGYHLWSERYDREMTDVFAIQEQIASSIAQRLEVSLDDGQQSFFKSGTRSLEAFKFYGQGRSLFFQRGPRLFAAIDCLRKAVELDPNYASAWSSLADALNTIAFYGFAKPDVSLPRAREAAGRAIELDPRLAEAHASLALSHLFVDWDWPAAERAFLRSFELKPQNSVARSWYGMYFLQWGSGRFEEGLAQARKAVEIDPLSAWSRGILAITYLTIDTQKAVETALEALRIDPESYLGRWVQMTGLTASDHYAEAAEIGELALRLFGRPLWFMASLARCYAHLGRPDDARAVYMELSWRAKREYVAPLFLAVAAFAAGEREEGIQWAQDADRIGDPTLLAGRYWPDFSDLREDARFQKILKNRGWR
jgi:TolB-like protein